MWNRSDEWFFEHIKRHKLIGWMDWLANVAVNVPTQFVIEYMGDVSARPVRPSLPSFVSASLSHVLALPIEFCAATPSLS